MYPFVLVLMSKSGSVIPSSASGGGSGRGLGSVGNIQGACEVEVHRVVLVRGRLAVCVLMLISDPVVLSLTAGGGSGRSRK